MEDKNTHQKLKNGDAIQISKTSAVSTNDYKEAQADNISKLEQEIENLKIELNYPYQICIPMISYLVWSKYAPKELANMLLRDNIDPEISFVVIFNSKSIWQKFLTLKKEPLKPL